MPAKRFDTDGWVMHCGSFSETLAPGYRVGWTSPGRFLRQVTYRKLTSSLATSLPAQLGIARYLERGHHERHLRALRLALRRNRDDYVDAISRHFPAGTRVSRPSGGYFLRVELPRGVDALALRREATDAEISLAPGPTCGIPPVRLVRADQLRASADDAGGRGVADAGAGHATARETARRLPRRRRTQSFRRARARGRR